MIFDPAKMDMEGVYKILTGLVVPRPIAWVSSRSPEGVNNLAPFSFFVAITPSPPYIAISIGERGGTTKDTLRNLQAAGDFVVNTVTAEVVEAMNTTSGDWPPEVSEFDVAGLTAIPSDLVSAPRIEEAVANMECVLRQILPVGGPPYGAHLVIAEVVRVHVRDGLVLERGRIDLHALHAVGRLAGSTYASTDAQYDLPRPVINEAHSPGR